MYLQLSALFLGIHGGIYTLPIQAISQDRETALEKRLAMRHDRLKSWKARRLAQKSWTTVPADYEIALAGQAGHQDPLGQHKEVNMPERIAPIWVCCQVIHRNRVLTELTGLGRIGLCGVHGRWQCSPNLTGPIVHL